MRYYLELIEDGHRQATGRPIGYDTIEQAKEAAMHKVGEGTPRISVRVLAHVATAYTCVDGGQHAREEE